MKTRYLQVETTTAGLLRGHDAADLLGIAYGLLVVIAVAGSYLLGTFGLLPFDPQAMDLGLMLAPPGSDGHLLGTDYLGRDLLSRLVVGIQAYFLPGLLGVGIALVLGMLLGSAAGWLGGATRRTVAYVAHLVDSFPRLVLILLVVAALKPDIYVIMTVVGLGNAPTVAKLIENKIQALRQRSFMESALALGLPARVVLLKHVLWQNCRALLIVQATLGMGEAILIETSLSYLGFGVQEPTPSWGNMVQSGANYLLQGQFWPSTAPALAIALTVSGFYLLGDGLNNLLERKR